ncbi:MAG: hypothetical protein JST41_11360 [Bacteroidetes bacterium]|jgi:hypothetical protein|nr:hypothetical protein [Bacteroidota bacterium]MBX7129567.1 hypothetical protein [Flavobacteriales bacterium]HMU13853.1 hypothetical protein [Flavobacteriales bacterium]HMW96808.1 hypothetical protein [Flavobacteriales bacterium]HNA32789.1 hypothetical protein [Flavobacteriales bacterium]
MNNDLLIDRLKNARSTLDPGDHTTSFATPPTGTYQPEAAHMARTIKLALLALTCGLLNHANAYNLRVRGVVTEYLTGDLLTDALVRVYKDGVKQQAEQTGVLGSYSFTLDNNAKYVLRFSAPGHQTKCFTIDTHGLEWEGEGGMKDLYVEMTLFQQLSDMDLSFFDMPMGMAFFEPATGLVRWDTDYDRRIRPEVQSLMIGYTRRMTAMANATSSIPKRRTQNDAAR